MYTTLCLSGGSVKSFYTLGSLQYLYEQEYLKYITIYIGTSAGAMICYLLAIGYNPIEIVVWLSVHQILEKFRAFDPVSMISGNGAMSYILINETLEKMTIDKIGKFITLQKLYQQYGKTLICTTYNSSKCQLEYLSYENYPDLPCLTALRMSSNIPMVFERFKYMNSYYIDGGVSDNFPIIKAISLGKTLGVYLQIDEKTLADVPEEGIVAYFFKLLYIPILNNTSKQVELAKQANPTTTIIPIITGSLDKGIEFSLSSKTRLNMFSSGYTQTKTFKINDLPNLLSGSTPDLPAL